MSLGNLLVSGGLVLARDVVTVQGQGPSASPSTDPRGSKKEGSWGQSAWPPAVRVFDLGAPAAG